MFRSEKNKFYIVNKDILPESILKTAMAKEILTKKEAATINEAVESVGLSRSAFYKYRDGVFPFYEASKEKIVTISIAMEHKPGILSKCLNSIADAKGNILTINQNIPLQEMAYVSISMETAEIIINLEDLLEALHQIPGVTKVELIGQS